MGIVFALVSPLAVRAQIAIVWGDSASDFGNGANWSGSLAPTSDLTTHIAVFSGAVPVDPDLAAARSIAGLSFQSGAGSYTVASANNSTLTLGASGLAQAGSAAQVVSLPLQLGAASSFTVGSTGGLTVSGTLATGGFALALTGSGSGGGAITGIVSGTGSLSKSGTSTWILSGANTYSGGTTLSGGTLRATTSAAALGTGTLSLGGGTLSLANDTNLSFGRNTTLTASTSLESDRLTSGAGVTHTLGTLSPATHTLSISAGVNVTAGTAGITFGATTLSADGAVFNPGAGTNLTLGALSGNFAFTKQGEGQLTLSTASTRNNASGSTTLAAGTLRPTVANALNTSAAAPLFLNGGVFQPAANSSTTFNGTSITLGGNATVSVDRLAAGTTVTHTLGALTLGGQTLTVAQGDNFNANTAGSVTFGATTLTGNPTFNLTNTNGTGIGNTTLGALSDGGVARTITKDGPGTLIFNGASSPTTGTSLVANRGIAQVNASNALGASALVDVTVKATTAGTTSSFNLNTGISQPIRSLTLGGAGATSTSTHNVSTSTGTLTLGGSVTYDATNDPLGSTISGSGAGNLALGVTRDFIVGDSANATADLTISTIISGTDAGLTKLGAGTLVLSGANTFTGPITLSAGTLRATTSAQALGTGAATLVLAGGTLELAHTSGLSFSRNTTLTTSSTIESVRTSNGAGITHTLGTLTLGAHTLTLDKDATVTSGTAGLTFGATTLTANGAVFNPASGTLLTLGALDGNFAFTKQGDGQLTLATESSRTGATTTLAAGILRLSTANALGTTPTPLALNGGTLSLFNSTATTFSGTNLAVGGNATLTPERAASGTAVTHTLGTLTLGTHTLTVAHGSNFSASNTGSVAVGATTLTGNPTFELNNTNGSGVGTLTLGAVDDGGVARTITKTGAATLVLDTNATSLVDGTTVNVNAGRLSLGSASALGTLADVNLVTGATLALTANSTVGSLDGTAGTVNLGTNTLTIGSTNNRDSTFGGATAATAGTLAKAGTGTLTLSGNNLHTGGTTVSAGTLRATTSAAALGSGAAALTLSGGTLELANDTGLSFSRNTTVTAPSTIMSDRLTGGAGVTHTLGTLSLGTAPLTINPGANVTSGTAGLTFGATTLTGAASVNVGAGTDVTLGVVGGSGGFDKTGAGPLTLSSAANTYTGATIISGGVLTVSQLANGGTNSGLGAATSDAGNLVLDGGTLRITAGGNTNRLFSVGTAGGTIEGNSVTAANFINTGSLGFNGESGSRTLTLAGTSLAGNILDSVVGDNGGPTTIVKADSGAWNIRGNNTYTGPTIITGGTLTAYSIADGGVSSTLGAPSSAASNLILNGGTLRYFGTAQSSDRLFSVGTAGGTILTLTGALNLTNTGSMGFNGQAGARTLTLGGQTTDGGNNILAATIGDNGGSTSVTKSDSATWILSGANTYTGMTSVEGGTLRLGATPVATSGSLAIAAKSGGGATFDLNGFNATYVDLSLGGAGSTAGSTSTITTGSGTLTFTSNLTSGAVSTGASTITGNLALGAGNRGINAGDTINAAHVLTISAAISGTGSGIAKTGVGRLLLSGSNTYTGPTSIAGGTVSVASIQDGGVASGLGASTNLASNLVLDGGTLRYTGAAQNTDRLFSVGLGGGTIDSSGSGALTFTNAGSLGSGGQTGSRTLTLSGSGTGTSSLAAVIPDHGGATAVTKSGTGTWSLTGSNTYTGVTTLDGGTLIVNSLASGGAASPVGASSNAAGNLVLNSGTLLYTGAGQTTDRLFSLGASPVTIESAGTGALVFSNSGSMGFSGAPASRSLTVTGSNSGNNTLAAVIGDSGGPTSVTKAGTGTWILSGANAYTGATTIGGILSVNTLADGGSPSAIGAASSAATNLTLSGGTLRYTGGAQSTDRLFSVGTSGGTFEAAGTGAVNFTNTGSIGYLGQSGSRTLTLTGNQTGNNTISASIGDNGGATSLVKSGAGTWVLAGANSYSGTTSISGGTLRLGASPAGPSGNVTINSVTAGATTLFDLNGFNATIGTLTFGGAGGTATSTSNLSTGAGTLTLGGNVTFDATGNPLGSTLSGNLALGATRTVTVNQSTNAANDLTISANISGSGFGLNKAGAGTLRLTGDSTFTGPVHIQASWISTHRVADSGVSSPLGAGDTIKIGNTSSVGTLGYTGTGHSTNRTVDLAGTTGGATIFTTGSGALVFTGNFTATGGGNKTLTLAGTGAIEIHGAIVDGPSGSVGLTKSTTGNLTLSSTQSTFSGNVAISNGTVFVGAVGGAGFGQASSFGSGASAIDLGSGSDGVTLVFEKSVFHGTGRALNLAGTTGGLTLTNNGTGQVSFQGGIAATGLGAKTLTLSGSGPGEIFGGITDSAAGATSLVKSGTGTWNLFDSLPNGFSGGISVSDGWLYLSGLVPSANTLAIHLPAQGSGGVLFYAGGTQTLSSLSGSNATVSIQNSMTVGINQTANSTFSGSIAASAGSTFMKSGIGTLALTGSLSGNTVISGGTLQLSGAVLSSSPPLTLNGGTLALTGFTNNAGTLTVGSGGGTIDFSSGSPSVISFADSSGIGWTGPLSITNYTVGSGDSLRIGTSGSGLTGGQLAAITFVDLGLGASIDVNGYLTPIPEPRAMAGLAGAAALAIAWYRRRRRQPADTEASGTGASAG